MASVKKQIHALKKRLILNICKPEMRVLPGQLAFFFFLTLIPLVALIGNFISLFDLPYESISGLFEMYFPKGTLGLLSVITVNLDLNFNLLLFFCTSIFLASNGPHSIIIASNQIYKIKDRGYLKRRLKALLMMFVVIILLLFILFIPVFGDMIFDLIATIDSQSIVKNSILYIYNFLKYPFSFLFIYIFIKILYIMAPDKRIEGSNVVYGSLFTSACWVVLTKLYSIYVEKFTNYSTFYGSISSVLILLLWLYLLCYVFVLGMALNASKYELDINNEKK